MSGRIFYKTRLTFLHAMQKVRHIKQLPVDLPALMDGLSSLLLPSQKRAFSHHMYASNIFYIIVKFSLSIYLFILDQITWETKILTFVILDILSGTMLSLYVKCQLLAFDLLAFISIFGLFFHSIYIWIRNCVDVKEVSRLPLSEDPALAMAFSVARRAAAVPLLLVNGTYRKNIHTYLDSSILQYQLQRLNEHGSLKGSLCDAQFFLILHCYSEILFIFLDTSYLKRILY